MTSVLCQYVWTWYMLGECLLLMVFKHGIRWSLVVSVVVSRWIGRWWWLRIYWTINRTHFYSGWLM